MARRVYVLVPWGWSVEWTSAVVDMTPQYCQRCESKVTAIRLTPVPLMDAVVVRCGHCNWALVRVPANYVTGVALKGFLGSPAVPPRDHTDTASPSDQ